MKSKNIDYIAACFAILFIFTMIGWLSWEVSALITTNSVREKYHSDNYASDAYNYIANSCIETDRSALSKCIYDKIKGTRDNQRAEHDLSAQEEMATWSLFMMFSSFGSLFFSIIGIYLIRGTLIEAAATSRYAMRGAKAARQANKIARRAMIASDRAWIGASIQIDPNGHMFIEGGKVSCAVRVKMNNTGNAPAINIQYKSWILFSGYGKPVPVQAYRTKCDAYRSEELYESGHTIKPGDTFPDDYLPGPLITIANSDVHEEIKIGSAFHGHFYLVLCVNYIFPTSMGKIFQVRQLYSIEPREAVDEMKVSGRVIGAKLQLNSHLLRFDHIE